MNGVDMNTFINISKSHGLHYLRRSMVLRLESYYSERPDNLKKFVCSGCCKTSMKKYVYAKASKEQMEKALATLLDFEETQSNTILGWGNGVSFDSMFDLEVPAK